MNSFNQKTKTHLNFMGGTSFDINNPQTRLMIAASSCFFGEPSYYHGKGEKINVSKRQKNSFQDHLNQTLNSIIPDDWNSKSPNQLIEDTIDQSLDVDVEQTLMIAAQLRNEQHIRTTPQVILVRAAHHAKAKGTGLIRKYAPSIIQRMDEPAVGFAYHLAAFKDKPIPNSLKKAWADKLNSASEYSLAKYRLENKEVKTVDVMNIAHPKSDAVNKLAKGELKLSDETWEAIISAEGSNAQSWAKAIDVMGHMALLRNLRNLLEKNIDPELFCLKLLQGVEKGQQLPFRYYSAYKAIENFKNKKAEETLDSCLSASIINLPLLKGRTMTLADNSGSAQGTMTSSLGTMKVSTIANLTGILAGMMSEEGHLGIFGDRLNSFKIEKTNSIFQQLNQAEQKAHSIGQGTENGVWLFFDKAIKNAEHWDNIFICSDMQAGHGGLYGTNPNQYQNYTWQGSRNIDVAKLISVYREKVNPEVNVFLCQVAGYQDTLVPEFYERTYILGGWGEGLLKFAAQVSNWDFK